MTIAAAGDGQPGHSGNRSQFLNPPIGEGGISSFKSIEPEAVEFGELRRAKMWRRVGEAGDSTRVVDSLDRVGDGPAKFGQVQRPLVAQPFSEGAANGAKVALLNEKPGDVAASWRRAYRYFGNREYDSLLMEALQNRGEPAAPSGCKLIQHRGETRIIKPDEVGEQVYFLFLPLTGDLDAWNDLEAGAVEGSSESLGLGHTCGRVMIGEGDGTEPALTGSPDDLSWAEVAIAEMGMDVEVCPLRFGLYLRQTRTQLGERLSRRHSGISGKPNRTAPTMGGAVSGATS